MLKSIKIIWYFYKAVLVWCILGTLFCIYFIFTKQLNAPLSYLCKFCSYGAILSIQYFNYNSTKTFFYFRNAGYSINRLYFYAFSFDLVAYSVLLSLSTIR
ncbi:hypothetical protein HDF22_001228 [Mucilaginibacter lappiensis]|uniref:Uncharacterized protein n=1 Tax=Mucilaginibacter lappiensis TaxID=354630 RepID=A0A841J9U1_9SPHI|nr:hypothetical protein [Mucilaginibacter lappiensis]